MVVEILTDYDRLYFRHIHNIARKLRKSDFNEIKSASGRNPYDVVMESCKISKRKWVILKIENGPKGDDSCFNIPVPVCLFGVVDSQREKKSGIPWMVATDMFDKIKIFALKNSLTCIDEVKRGYDRLYNFVDARNLKAIEWLSMCGFTIHEAISYGKEGLPFYMFDMECG